MKQSIAFVANYHLTEVFLGISSKIFGQYEIYWIVFSKWDLQKLIDSAIQSEYIVYLPMNAQVREDLEEFTYIPYNELIFADRVLRLNPRKAKKYLRHVANEVMRFFSASEVITVFGESTWAHERIIGRIAAHEGRNYYTPHTVRFPKERFAFFEGELQNKLLERKAPNRAKSLVKLPDWENPSYVEINNKDLRNQRRWRYKIYRIFNFITARNIDKNSSLNIVGFKSRLLFGMTEEFNRLTYRYLIKRHSLSRVNHLKYYVYALHKQPEASIDVFGRFYEDQFINIRILQRALPDGHSLVVKEHSNAIGDRDYSFYKKVEKLQDVILISENVNTRELIASSKGVFSVSGTIAFEAAYLGVRSYTFIPMFFNNLPMCSWCSLDFIKGTRTLLDLECKAEKTSSLEALNYIISHSFEGLFTDANTNPAVLSDANIQKLTEAFITVLKEHNN